MFVHKSVLLKEAIEYLKPGPGRVIVDGTLGLGGHSEAILEMLGSSGRLVGIDQDEKAIEKSKALLKCTGEQTMFFHENFGNICHVLDDLNINSVDGMLLDLGVSSMQLEDAGRGFSFSLDGPLDMRMDVRASLNAKEIVNTYSEFDIAKILWEYGEERFSRRIARAIVDERQVRVIGTTAELARLISHAVPKFYRYGRIHPATKSFQALRIAVNREMESLRFFLNAVSRLSACGRMVIISFHSLEDRMVKQSFKKFQEEGLGAILTKKPIVPTDEEIAANPRARSAKMRVFEKGEC